MTRMLTKFALYALALATLVDMSRYHRRRVDRQSGKDALMTREDEGGSLPSQH